MNHHKRFFVLAFLLIVLLIFMGCAPGNERWNQDINPGETAGFWAGLWHGLIIIVSFIVSLFTKDVTIYEVSNTGWPYNLGFIIGLIFSIGIFGPCGKKKKKKIHKLSDDDCARIEESVRTGIKDWLDKDEQKKNEEWEEIARKIEEKVRKSLKDWLNKP
ncbi:hypothetical protein KKG05_07105 [bacterium]|nr:hypothetical protein [bacterium]